MDKSGKEGKHGGCWGTILFPYLLGLGLGGILRCHHGMLMLEKQVEGGRESPIVKSLLA